MWMNIDVENVILPSKLQQAVYIGQVTLLQLHPERLCWSLVDLDAVSRIELMKLSDFVKNNTVPKGSRRVMPVVNMTKIE